MQRGCLQPRNDNYPRFPHQHIRSGTSPSILIREDNVQTERENDNFLFAVHGRQTRQPLASVMTYQHANISSCNQVICLTDVLKPINQYDRAFRQIAETSDDNFLAIGKADRKGKNNIRGVYGWASAGNIATALHTLQLGYREII